MTRKAAKINIDDEAGEPEKWKESIRVESMELTADDELDDVLADFPQNDACIELYRINAQGGRPAFLEEMMPSGFSFASVKREYGGGRYMAKGRYANGTRKKMSFEIEGEPIPVRRKFINVDNHAPVFPTGQRSIETEAIPPVRADGQDFQAAMVEMMGKMISQSRESETQVLEKMRLYKDLFGGNQQPVKEAPLDVALNMFQKGVEMAAMNGGGDNQQSFWLMAIREMKDPLLKIVDTIQSAIAQPKQINPAVSGGKPVVATVNVPTSETVLEKKEDPMLSLLPIIKSYMPSLVNGAAKNSDPGLYVDFLLDQIPTTAYPGFHEWLMKPGCLDQLAMFEPGVRFQKEWWESLRAALIEGLSEELHGASNVQPSENVEPTAGHAEHDEALT